MVAPPTQTTRFMSFDEKKVLRRAARLRIELDRSPEVGVFVEDRFVACGHHGLAVLEAFSGPTSVADGMKSLKGRSAGMQDWVDLITTVRAMYEAGVLVDADEVAVQVDATPRDFASAPIHLDMLQDRTRTSAFLSAIRTTVGPDDVVVDLGTGTGVLAIAAAEAGARHVYAIEATGIADTAQALFEANGVADRITLVRGWSTQVSLPERGTVLLSEIIGTEALEEGALEAVRDARKRLLEPDARLIPAAVRIFGTPVTIPGRVVRKHTFMEGTVDKWRRWYDMDFSPLAQIAKRSSRRFGSRGRAATKWTRLADPALLLEIDLRASTSLTVDARVRLDAHRAGTVNGVLTHFELELGPAVSLSTDPSLAGRPSHWGNTVWMVDPVEVAPGGGLEVQYRYQGLTTVVSCELAR